MANTLAAPLAAGLGVDGLLHKGSGPRLLPTRVIQRGQKLAQDNIIGAVLSGAPITRAPLPIRMLDRLHGSGAFRPDHRPRVPEGDGQKPPCRFLKLSQQA